MKKSIVPLFLSVMAFMSIASAEEMPMVVDEPLSNPATLTAAAFAQTDPTVTELDHSLVTRIQGDLIKLGLLDGDADGLFGPKTSDALTRFQARNGLAETGLPNEATLERLESSIAETADVKALQQRLCDLGYLKGAADGLFGPQSTEALKLFQGFHGLQATGIADPETTEKLFSDDAKALPAGLSSGERGDAVAVLQQRLIELGFTDDQADGIYGEKTVAAVKAFQQHLVEQGLAQSYGITSSGDANALTQYFLFSPTYSTYARTLQAGAVDSEATRVERRLRALGYMDKAPTDTLDDYAMTALGLFREKAGLPAAEVVDRQTFEALFAANAPVADHYVPHDIAAGDSGIAVSELETAMLQGGMITYLPTGKYDRYLVAAVGSLHKYLSQQDRSDAPLFEDAESLTIRAQEALADGLLGYHRTVETGAPSEEVLRVQRRLNTLLYLGRDSLDGLWGRNSRAALKLFQANNGLEETGIADEATQAVLFSGDAVSNKVPYRAEISLAKQQVQLYALQPDGSYENIKTFVCSTGLGNSTPRGFFLDGFPVNRWHYFQKFDCWAQYSYEVEGNIMLHSVIYSHRSEDSLRTSSVYALGSQASHGCVRLNVEDACWLFENCPKGSLAIIIY